MSRSLAKPGSTPTALNETPPQPLEVLPAARARSGFSSFSYTVTEVSMHGERTSVRARQTRLEDGRLTTETFEGELDRGAYADAVQAAQQQVQAQMDWMQRAMAWWLPWLPGGRRGGG